MNCKRCGAPIIWAKTASGKKIPLDPDPVEIWNITLFAGQALVIKKGENPPGPRYVSHFATCPGAGEFRREKS